MTRTRIEPIDRDVALILREDLSPAAQAAALARFAGEQRDEATAINERVLGYEPHQDTFVDGARSNSLAGVKADSRIVVEFDIINDLFAWIDLMLIGHAPQRSGRFRRSFIFTADEVAVDPNGELPDAAEFVFTSTAPYARKIERGASSQAPDGVFQAVAVMAARKFGNVARIRFGYRSVIAGEVDSWAASTKLARRGRNMKEPARAEWLRRQPAIIITR